ncbi:hypothetical protein [Serratia liquefaciens]|uniref:hypothetical protein n=1 Tax=Serratia liquefaciens TaxID=614 RepID=UPI00217C0F2D|nr:hypothetical protein [Serratia liquefaciens]CAI0779342.1 Uncharacterised protein [Serratia liquefaciens]
MNDKNKNLNKKKGNTKISSELIGKNYENVNKTFRAIENNHKQFHTKTDILYPLIK